ncbi:NAD(P)H-dependent oxidoreductase [Neisseria sp.]|uniref:NAD(P)H-dependent oxidoreductase n=1 Tax=Neisseria sp. TaxID=192066 RepID=UPI0035A0ACF9
MPKEKAVPFTTIVYAHPYEKSFNHAVLQRVRQLLDGKGEPYRIIDLYADGFNPAYTKEELALFNQGRALDPLVQEYQRILRETRRLIFIFPVWWADVPAIVKGFEDKVFLKTLTYEETPMRRLVGKLTHIREAVALSTSTAPTWYLKYFCGDTVNKAMLNHTLKAVGVGSRKWVNFGNISQSTAAQRQAFLEKLERYI